MIRRSSYALACAVLALTGEAAGAGTCLTADIMNPSGQRVSQSDSQSQQSAIASTAERATGSEDQAVKVANQPNRSLYIELARTNSAELATKAFDFDAQIDAALAQLVTLYALDARPMEGQP
ncbi:hypothetical protein [Methylorubrum extorquens]|uniref:hypothetical protein n=1 Tax=Methylorubrum extorquens TaxID=408 RepID=UPI0006807ABD|nr:hypothetical protein [Methylorubrum extorquens]